MNLDKIKYITRNWLKTHGLILALCMTSCLVTASSAAEEASTVKTNIPLTEILKKWQDVPLPEVTSQAEKGDLTAQHFLGYYYFQGLGGSTNYVEGVRWYRQAAEKGFPNSQNNLGVAYLTGKGVEKDVSQAIHWYRLAAAQNMTMAQRNLSALLLETDSSAKNYEEARKLLELAARAGDAEAQLRLGKLCYSFPGRTMEFENALYWYRKAYAQGRMDACSPIGWVYHYLQQDDKEAVRWFKMGADAGDSSAQCSLGYSYFVGMGINPDAGQAIEFTRKAAAQNHVGAMEQLGNYYSEHDVNSIPAGWQPDYQEAARWYRQAADKGNKKCAFRFGELVWSGQAKGERATAVNYIRQAADANWKDAKFKLATIYLAKEASPRGPEDEPWKLIQELADRNYADARSLMVDRMFKEEKNPDYVKAACYYIDSFRNAEVGILSEPLLDGHNDPLPGLSGDHLKLAKSVSQIIHAFLQKDAAFLTGMAARYETGDSFPQNLVEAAIWYRLAADDQDKSAAHKAKEIENKLDADSKAKVVREAENLNFWKTWLRQNQ